MAELSLLKFVIIFGKKPIVDAFLGSSGLNGLTIASQVTAATLGRSDIKGNY